MVNCPKCGAALVPGNRWCTICHTNLLQPGAARLSSPGRRLGAYLLDGLIPLIAFSIITGLAGASSSSAQGSGVGVVIGSLLLLAYGIWAIVLFTRGRTPGKLLLGMRVVREDLKVAGFWTMLIREWIGKLISGLILSIGFLWILFDKDKQGWHDKLMSTYVVE